jgi:hypothetical protein
MTWDLYKTVFERSILRQKGPGRVDFGRYRDFGEDLSRSAAPGGSLLSSGL